MNEGFETQPNQTKTGIKLQMYTYIITSNQRTDEGTQTKLFYKTAGPIYSI